MGWVIIIFGSDSWWRWWNLGIWLPERSVRIPRNHILTIWLDTQFTEIISYNTEIAVIAVTKIKISQHTFCNFQDFLSVWILESNVSELCSCKYFKSINSIKEIRYWYRVSQKKLVFRISALYGIYCSLWALQRPSYYW